MIIIRSKDPYYVSDCSLSSCPRVQAVQDIFIHKNIISNKSGNFNLEKKYYGLHGLLGLLLKINNLKCFLLGQDIRGKIWKY